MVKLEGFRIRNFRALKDLKIGRLWNLRNRAPLMPMTTVIGGNGVGKSSLFDAFGFLADCLKSGVEVACDAHGRGGFERIFTQGASGAIEFEVYYRETSKARPITYELSITQNSAGRPFVSKERLRQRRSGQSRGWPFSFLVLENGKGLVWKGEQAGLEKDEDFAGLMERVEKGEAAEEFRETEVVELDNKQKLGVATLGSLTQHPRISAFRRFIEGWYLSYFDSDAARSLPLAGPQEQLNSHGDNLGNVVQFMEREHPQNLQGILKSIAEKIPEIDKIDTEKSNDGRLLLRFSNKSFQKPFYAQQMSDGTLKTFAYLLLIKSQGPSGFLCIEEPENGLYHKILEPLATEFREYAEQSGGAQLFITTHQPYFINALNPKEIWVMKKGRDGFSSIKRASDIEVVNNMVEEGLPLGGLWYSDYLDS